MIDFVSIQIININISDLLKNTELNFTIPVNTMTGELITHNRNGEKIQLHKTAYYKGLKFVIYDSGFVKIDGSLHKYWNNGGHNFNDFNIDNIFEVLTNIETVFNIKPEQMILRQLEIGVNIKPPYPTSKILEHCFLHKTTPFVWKFNSDEGKYIQAEHSQYIIKIYDKKRHYTNKGFKINAPDIMRFEIKYRKLEKIKRKGILSIKDLLNYKLGNFIKILSDEWGNVLFYDFTIKSNSKLLPNYKNPLYWSELTKRRSAFNKHRKQLKNNFVNCSENIQNQISNIITTKGYELTYRGMQIDRKKSEKSDTIEKAKKQGTLESKNNYRGTQIDTLCIMSKCTPLDIKNKHICTITGLNISMQKETSIYLSHTGLKYYYRTNKRIFNEIKSKYLSDLWETSDYKTQIKEIAHNIRTKASNIKVKQKRLYPKRQYNLFTNKDFSFINTNNYTFQTLSKVD